MKQFVFFSMAVLLFTAAHAQSKKGRIYVMPQAALLNGDNYVSGQAALSAGWQSKRYAVGIGAAIDYYKLRTVPVFASARCMFGKNEKVFAYLNTGPDFTWPLVTQTGTHWLPGGTASYDAFRTGWYTDAGIGYSVRIEKNEMLISIGYSLKTVHQSYQEAIYKMAPPFTPEIVDRKLDFNLNRLALRIGLVL